MTHVAVTVNGTPREADVEPRTLLVYFLRETLGLTGTNVGCDTSSCGSCTVLLDGESVKSCTLLAAQADGREVTTIEGLASNGDLHPLQEAFHRNHGLQCGYCTPGMLLAAASYLKENPTPTEEDVRESLGGQPLPLHRLPEHREVDPRRRRVHERREGLRRVRMATTELYIGAEVLRKEDPELVTGQANFIDNHDAARHGVDGDGAPAVRPRDDQLDRHVRGEVDARRRRRLHGGRPARSGRCRSSGRSPRTSRSPCTTRSRRTRSASTATRSPWSWPRRASRRSTRPRTSRSTSPSSRPSTTMEDAMADGAPLIHEELGSNVTVHWSHGGAGDQGIFESAPVIVQEHYHQPRLDPERDRAPRLPRLRRSRRWGSSRCGAPRRSRTSRR